MVGIMILLSLPIYEICVHLLGLSWSTAVCVIITIWAIIYCVFSIATAITIKKKLKREKKCKAVVIDKKEIMGYKGKTTYFVKVDNAIVEKDNMHVDFKINEEFEVIPLFDENKNIVDFDYNFDLMAKPSIKVIIFTILLSIGSIFLVLSNKEIIVLNNIFSGIALSILLLIGIYQLYRKFIYNKGNLTPVKANVIAYRRKTRIDPDIPDLPPTSPTPIYSVIINSKEYRFLGEKSVPEKDAEIGKEVTVFYDEKTMEFFDSNSNQDFLIGVILVTVSILGFISMFF